MRYTNRQSTFTYLLITQDGVTVANLQSADVLRSWQIKYFSILIQFLCDAETTAYQSDEDKVARVYYSTSTSESVRQRT